MKRGINIKPITHLLRSFTKCYVGLLLLLSPNLLAEDSNRKTGYNALFMGHSFFWPAGNEVGKLAPKTAINNHQQHMIKGGGKTGSAKFLWDIDKLRTAAQQQLDTGKINLLVMVYRNPDNSRVEDFSRWFDYALSKNPKTTFMVTQSWATLLHTVDNARIEQLRKGAYWMNKNLIEKLRKIYTKSKILFCPHMLATYELISRFKKGKLPGIKHVLNMDPVARKQSRQNGDQLLNDPLGHPGELVAKLGGLLMLKTIYDVDLNKAEPIRARNLPNIDLNKIAETLSKEIEPFNY